MKAISLTRRSRGLEERFRRQLKSWFFHAPFFQLPTDMLVKFFSVFSLSKILLFRQRCKQVDICVDGYSWPRLCPWACGCDNLPMLLREDKMDRSSTLGFTLSSHYAMREWNVCFQGCSEDRQGPCLLWACFIAVHALGEGSTCPLCVG